MQFKKLAWAAAALLIAVVLPACNIGRAPEPTPDVNAIYTSAAQTMIADLYVQQTQTAQAMPPTPQNSPTPFATFTPLPVFPVGTGLAPLGTPFTLGTPGFSLTPLATVGVAGTAASSASGCDDSAYMGQTVADGTVFRPGQDFRVGFEIENTGTCTWDEGYSFVYQGGTLDGYSIDLTKSQDFVKPGHTQSFVVNLTASLQPNTYTDCWKMRNDHNYYFGTYACITIKVEK